MIGIGVFGDEHEKRVRGIIERLTPEIYLLLLQAQNIACKYLELKDTKEKDSYERYSITHFIDTIRDSIGQTRLPGEEGEWRTIYFDITYVNQNGGKI